MRIHGYADMQYPHISIILINIRIIRIIIMISTDFAPNESWDDAWLSLKLLFQPWRWKNGKELDTVKKEISKLFRVTRYTLHVTLFLSGRSALYFLLQSLSLPKNSEVLVQAFTCEAVVLPILANKLKPVYVDIEAETYSMDFTKLSKLVTLKTKVLILQHTFGLTPKYRKEILEFAKKNRLTAIEDLAHGFDKAIFSTPNPYLLSTNYYLLSFGRSKSISSVFGGALICTDNRLTEKLNNLSFDLKQPSSWFIFHSLLYKPLAMFIKSTYDIYLGKILHKVVNKFNLLVPEITKKEKSGEYNHFFDKAYPNALSILLLHQLNKFDQIQKNRAKICSIYKQHFKNVTRYALQVTNQPLIRYPILITNRDQIIKKAAEKNIFLGKWYDQVVAPKDLNLIRVVYKPGSCPVAEEICKKIINLPTLISEKQAEKVINILVLSVAEGLNDVK